MLNKLHIQNCFAHTNSTFDFHKGLTAITGANFKGKSQILEMIRFALFGSGALRTNATDYKGAKVALDFTVKDKSYRVERTISHAKLYEGGELLTTGTKPTNQKIVDIFGYGLEVFDTANVATQGMIEALGAMRPADRKRLVDSTIGLNVIDDLGKWCQEEGALKGRELMALRSVSVKPSEPVKPEGYRPLAEIMEERVRALTLVTEKSAIERDLKAEPVRLEKPDCAEPRGLEELETSSRNRRVAEQALVELKRDLSNMPPASPATLEEIEAVEILWNNYEAQSAAEKFMKEYPTPRYTTAELDIIEEAIHRYDRWKAWKQLDNKGHICCPACKHTWPAEAERMKEFGDWTGITMDPPHLNSLLVVQKHRIDWDLYNARTTERAVHRIVLAAHPNPLGRPLVSRSQLDAWRNAHGAAPRRATTMQAIYQVEAELALLPDVALAIKARASYEKSLRLWERAEETHKAWATQVPGWQGRLGALAYAERDAEKIIALQVEVSTYDNLHTAYAKALEAYLETQAKIVGLEAEVDQYSRARAGLTELKSRVKGYLVPSLSRVGSAILSQMTGGALGDISVSEDFDIMVGAKPIDGLSGCGKAAANIALRIALGQVLTNKVFSVFCGDELDSAMDEENATYTAECLRRLTSSISQVILVSHKTPEADHYIKL